MRWSGVICCGLLAAGAMVARGQEHYVSHWGSNVPPYTSWETAATNLMDAVNVASNGATIWVSNGVYRTGSGTGGGLDARVMLTRPLVLRSVNGASNTFIEGAAHSRDEPLGPGAVRGVYMTDGVLDGFTLRHGHTDSGGGESANAGAGVYAEGGTLLNIRVIGNHGQTAGGGWLEGCRISNGVFRLNESETGPRVRIHQQVELEDCRIQNGMPPTADLKILGTNGAVIVNGDPDMDAGNGAWFGPHHVATGMVSQTFVLTNQGVRTLVIEGVEAQGGHTGDFTVVVAPPSVLQPGESAPLTIRFDPTAKGFRRALFYVKSSDADDDPYA
ncbi:MAG: choice-of-anchor D domain-containing protein, partial [Opitutae bacterium]|nr:choice-of-anchor D domain-containing protein [Opitutae bacterium]